MKAHLNIDNEREDWQLAAPYLFQGVYFLSRFRPSEDGEYVALPMLGDASYDLAAAAKLHEASAYLMTFKEVPHESEFGPTRVLRKVKLPQRRVLSTAFGARRSWQASDNPSDPYFLLIDETNNTVKARAFNGRALWETIYLASDVYVLPDGTSVAVGRYVTGTPGSVRRYDEDGTEIWTRELEDEYGDVPDPVDNVILPHSITFDGVYLYVTANDLNGVACLYKINSGSGTITSKAFLYPQQGDCFYGPIDIDWHGDDLSIYVGCMVQDVYCARKFATAGLSQLWESNPLPSLPDQISTGDYYVWVHGQYSSPTGRPYWVAGAERTDGTVEEVWSCRVTAIAAAREGDEDHPIFGSGVRAEKLYVAEDLYLPVRWSDGSQDQHVPYSEGDVAWSGDTLLNGEMVPLRKFCIKPHTNRGSGDYVSFGDNEYWQSYDDPVDGSPMNMEPNEPDLWQPNTSYHGYQTGSSPDYSAGHLVRYRGKRYRCKLSHTSNEDNKPPSDNWVLERNQFRYRLRKILISGYGLGGWPEPLCPWALEEYWLKRLRQPVYRLLHPLVSYPQP